jgi:hypothetical protein
MAISDGGLLVLKNDIYFAFRQLRQSAFSTSELPISIKVTSFFRELVQVLNPPSSCSLLESHRDGNRSSA